MVAAEGAGNFRILMLLVPWKMFSFKHISLKQSSYPIENNIFCKQIVHQIKQLVQFRRGLKKYHVVSYL